MDPTITSMTTATTSDSVVASDISNPDLVHLYVGKKRELYTAHKADLQKIPFLEKCLNGSFQESKRNVINLSHEEPCAAQVVLQYAKDATLTEFRRINRKTKHEWLDPSSLVLGYMLADQWCVEGLCNIIADTFKYDVREYQLKHEYISSLTSRGLTNCPLRWLLLHLLAKAIQQRGWDKYMRRRPEVLQWIERGGEDIVDLMKVFSEVTAKALPLRDRDVCRWHHHRMSNKCTASAIPKEWSRIRKASPGNSTMHSRKKPKLNLTETT